ncbi:MAG: hypothetical protein VB081_05070 [Christensenella sp.]|uniref:hypothetical protein n=1 Tax=Christensenella sp. TaxID=1935934 RepID=UPI002B1F713D|nr:hypothetical protein [Christensenella sp.]MEA5002850.1 hypothetical protein [Christensenella sp.]
MFKKRFVIIISLICAMAFLFVACTASTDTPSASATSGAKEIRGTVEGGDASLGTDVNLKDINIEKQGENTVITMSFLNGSRTSGVDESKISSVPKYGITILGAPVRLQVDLNIGFWDYSNKNEWFTDSIIYGMFNTVHSDSNTVSVYFQMNEGIEATVSEDADKLVITLTPNNASTENAFFVGLNAYEEYEQNLITPDLGFAPTMCEGLSDIILISSPKKDEASAKKLAEETNLKIASVAPAKKAYVFEMSTDALPVYNKEVDAQGIQQDPVMMVAGAPITLPVLVENGRYLCQMPDGSILYARSYVPNASEDTEQVLKEKLWRIETNGKKTQLELPDFYGIEKAAPSSDGRYIAILDSGIENKVLYVFDTQESVLHNLGEEGFGDATTSFVWDQQQPVIYAMTGLGTLQLMKYDFTVDIADRVQAVEEKKGAESKIALRSGKIYFADKTENNGQGMIYSLDLTTKERVEVAAGIDFALSQDGVNMAVLVPVLEGEEDITYNVQMLNTGTAAVTDVIGGVLINSMTFGADNDTLYFTTPTYDGTTAEYPFAVVKYSVSKGELSLVGYSKTSEIIPGTKTGEFYVVDYFNQGDNSFYITYIYEDK